MSDHAEQRRRLYLAMRDNPNGITSKDFAAHPTLDGGEPIPRVAARIMELRAEHTIPEGLRDHQKFAIYKLDHQAAAPNVRALRVACGFVPVTVCHGCLTTHPHGFRCPHGRRVEDMLTHDGAVIDGCLHQVQEVRRAA